MEVRPIISSVDPITFEILSHRLYQIAKEMGTALERVGGTVNTTQMHDYMASLYLANGDVLSAGDSMGWHVACAGFAVKRIIERFENTSGIHADDIFLLNDPYLAAIHQSDVYLISPIHFRGRLVGWSATFVHVMDIGAMSPGGNSPGATEICHEGIRIPGIKLVEGGRLRQDLFDAIINMTRQPVMVGLDLKCEIAANNVAKARMQALYEQFGPELVTAVSQEMLNYSEAILRRRIAEIPDGSWSDTGSIHAGETWKVHVKLTKKGDHLLFDFTGSSPQAKKGINLPYHATFGACYESILCTLAYDLPKNHGASEAARSDRAGRHGGQSDSASAGIAQYDIGRRDGEVRRQLGDHANACHQREMATRGHGAQCRASAGAPCRRQPAWQVLRLDAFRGRPGRNRRTLLQRR